MSRARKDGRLGGAHKRRAKQGKEMWKPGSWFCCPCRYGKRKCARKVRHAARQMICNHTEES